MVKIIEKIILGSIEKHMKDIFYDKGTHLAEQGKSLDVNFSNFSKAFNTISHSNFLDKMSSKQLKKFTLFWVSN